MLEELKKRLKITWNEEDDNFKRSLEAGKEYLEGIAGTTLDFEGSSFNKSLLFEYCRYDYNDAIEYFESNFSKQLIQLQIRSVVQKDDK